MPRVARWTHLAVCVVCVSLLSACGGGGGGGSPPPPSSGNPNTPPPSSGNPNTPPVGSFSVSQEPLTFVSDDATPTPASQRIALSVTGVEMSDVFFQVNVSGSGIYANVTSDGAVNVTPTYPSLLSPGVHTATVEIRACTPNPGCVRQLEGSPKTIQITHERHGLEFSPVPVQFTVRNGASQADRTVALTVTGYPEQTFTVDTNRPWLTLSRSSGSTADPVPIDAIFDESGGLLKNGVHSATIRVVTPTHSRFYWVSVNVDRTQVNTVAPYLGVLFEQRDVIIRGNHFDAAEISGVRFGGTAATSFTVVSDTEIRARTPGSITSGSYPVTLTGNAASAISTANFKVVDPAPLFSNHLPLPAPAAADAQPIAIVYDAPSERIFVAVDQPAGTPDFVARYTYQLGGTWAAANAYNSYGSLKAMTLALDGESVLLSQDDASFDVQGFPTSGIAVTSLRLDGGSWSSLHSDGWTSNFINSIAMANDGRAVLVSAADDGGLRPVFRYSSISPSTAEDWSWPTLERLAPTDPTLSGLFDNGVAGATGDGSRVLIGTSVTTGDLYEYDAATSSLRRTDQVLRASAIQLDRTGSRILLNNTDVYDGSFQLLGHLPANTIAAVFSPSVPRIYAYDSNGQLSSYNVAGSTVTPIRTWSPGASAGDPQRRVVMTITPEDWTLLIAGTNGVLVEHIPDNAR